MRGNSWMAVATIALTGIYFAAKSAGEEAREPQEPIKVEQSFASPDETVGTRSIPSVTVLGSKQAQSVLGKEVRSATGEDMGRIIDVIVDKAGRVRAAVIDFGGFLGVGSRRIAVDWQALRFSPASSHGDVVTLELTRDQVKAAPEYKEKQAVIVLGPAGALHPLAE
jgi:hypothetical protein